MTWFRAQRTLRGSREPRLWSTMGGVWRSGVLAASAMAASATSAMAQAPANDNCASPTAITGVGTFNFDLSHATPSPEGPQTPCSTPGVAGGYGEDVWFCWTATCTGLVTVSTCGGTQDDTKIAIYAGCGCPGTPGGAIYRCCNDDACGGKQSLVTCEVVCGQQYMIRIGRNISPIPPGSGTFTIDCAGQPCPPSTASACCSARPIFASRPAPAGPGFTGRVVAMTLDRDLLTGAGSEVVELIDVEPTGSNVPPVGCTPNPSNWNTGFYKHPSWTKDNLGTVFGVCFDDRGNTYVAHTAIYSGISGQGPGGGDLLGALAGGGAGAGAGAIYLLDTNTGAASLFAKLDNNSIPGCTPPNASNPRASDCYPGLGNISFDCVNGQLFVSNFMDGRIYRLSRNTGAILSTFKHASGLVQAGGGSDLVNNAGYIPLGPTTTGRGQRVWAVERHGNRLFYSVWREDYVRPDPNNSNEIWSIALNGSGDFVPNSEQLEITMPVHQSLVAGYPPNTSDPVADISFDPSGCLLAAERTMAGDSASSAHQSRLVKFCRVGGAWVPAPYNYFITGVNSFAFLNGANSAGGVDCDLDPAGRIWNTGDALLFAGQTIYGLQGFPVSGGDTCVSYLIDSDQNTTSPDKFYQGSVAATCTKSCSSIDDVKILCALNSAGGVNYTFTITNNSGVTAYYALLTPPIGSGVTFTPNIIPLPPLANGSSTTVSTTIQGATPGQQLCFNLTLVDQNIQNCCSIEHCIDIPRCDCAQVRTQSFMCIGPGMYTYTFTLANLSGGPIQHIFLFPPAGITFAPNYFALGAPLPNFGTVNLTTTVTGAPGQQFCFRVSVHDQHLMECCSIEHCVTLPSPCNSIACALDINGDGIVNFLDLNIMLWHYGNSGPNVVGDVNHDGKVDFLDLNLMLSNFGSPC